MKSLNNCARRIDNEKTRAGYGVAGRLAVGGALKAPEDPITINLNVKIDHEIRLKVEKDIDQLFSEDSDLF